MTMMFNSIRVTSLQITVTKLNEDLERIRRWAAANEWAYSKSKQIESSSYTEF